MLMFKSMALALPQPPRQLQTTATVAPFAQLGTDIYGEASGDYSGSAGKQMFRIQTQRNSCISA